MALDVKTAKEIQDFVYLQPRTVQEVARLISKNWRTAEAYVDEIVKQYGTIGLKTFRPGTKAALKIVYWAHIEKVHSSQAQEELFLQIKNGRTKTDFDPYDLYQFAENKSFAVSPASKGSEGEILEFISGASKSMLNFGGNLSWMASPKACAAVKKLAQRGVAIKILARIDVASMKNLHEIEKINNSLGYEAIEVRHRHQPLRCYVIDSISAQLKDEKEKKKYKGAELEDDIFIFYRIMDPQWTGWLEKVFWNLFSQSPPARERVEELKRIRQGMIKI